MSVFEREMADCSSHLPLLLGRLRSHYRKELALTDVDGSFPVSAFVTLRIRGRSRRDGRRSRFRAGSILARSLYGRIGAYRGCTRVPW